MAQFYDTWRSGGTGRGPYTLTPRATDEIPLTIDLLAGQSVAGFRVRNSAGGILFSIDQNGNVTISGSISAVINETVTGDLTLTGNLTVVGNSVLGDAVGDTLTVNATSTFVNPVSMASTLAIAGITTTQSLISTTRLGLRRRGATPAPIGVQGQLYTRAGDADTTELFYLDPAGNDVQITDAGALEGASLFWDDDEYIRMGNTAASPDVRMGWNTAQTVDAWYFGTADAQNVFLIAENGDRAFDFAHGAQTNPTLFIHSATPSTTQWLSLTHNQTDAIIISGLGFFILDAPSGIVLRDSGVTGLLMQTDGTTATWTVASGDNIAIRTTGATTDTIIFQSQTFTSGQAHNAVSISPTWTAENFNHTGLSITVTQNGANTQTLSGLIVTGVKATAATTLVTFAGINIAPLTVTGTVTNNYGIYIQSQTAGSSNYGLWSDSNNFTWNLGAGNQFLISATAHTSSPVVSLDFDVNSVSVNGLGIDGEVSTALSAGEIMNGIAIDVDGNATDAATSQVNGIAITSAGTTSISGAGANTGIRMNGYWDTGILISRSVNFTGVDTETSFDINIVPVFTLTEPAAGAYQLFGINVDLSGIAVTAGAGTSTLAALRLVANADADVGLNLALFVDSGLSRFDDQIMWGAGVAVTAGNYSIGRDADATNQLHLNVPTGATFEWSINDVAEMTLSATAVNFQNNSITTTGGGSLTGTWTDLGAVTTIDINGGTLDGVIIGGASAAAATVTTLSMNNLIAWSAGAAITAGNYQIGRDADGTNQLHLNAPTGAGFEFSVNDVPVSTMNSDGQTWILPATGALTIDAGTTTDHTAANVITMDLDINSASVNGFNFDIDVGTALSLAETVNGLNIDIDGLAGDHAGSAMNGINLTSANNTGGVNSAINITGTWDYGVVMSGTPLMFDLNMNATTFINNTGVIDLVRSGNFTGVDTQTSIDFNIAPSFTLTEPAGGTFTLYGANIDLSGISVTAGAGTTVLAALRLVANADADVGTNLALFVDAGTTRLDGLLQQNDAIYFTQTDGNERIDSAADGYLDYTVTTAHRFNMSAADTDVRLEFVGTTASGLLEWMEDEDYFRFGDSVLFNAGSVQTAANVDVNMSAGGRFYGGGVQINSQTLAANTNLTMDENDGHIDITSGAVSANVITLPAASGNQGMIVSFYLEVDGGQNANIQRAGADVIQNGSADLANTQVALDDAGDYLMLQCVSASMWQIIVNNGGTVT